ncbi:hypothetical protein JCM10213_005644 [Rhodosporidiobolus nylandii]
MAEPVASPAADSTVPRSPPPLKPVSPPPDIRTRRIVIAAFWAVVLLGVPFWWTTTTLERRALPAERVRAWETGWEERIRREGVVESALAAEPDSRVVKFSPHYKLVFSLLNQDASAGSAVLDWDASRLLSSNLRPFLSSLAPLHNFTIESHVQFFAPLAIELHEDEAKEGVYLEEEDLRAFVNNAEWNMASGTTLDPVLHFLLYVPSAQNRPMRIRKSDGQDATPAFISPQRGGVVIFNPPSSSSETPPSTSIDLPLSSYSPSFSLFEQQLRTLLGVPSPSSSTGALTASQRDTLVQRRLREAVKASAQTLAAIVKLAVAQPNMRIGKEVQSRVTQALDELDEASAAAPYYPSKALSHAALAQSLAEKAYFDPSMLALLYFPDEHKYAVYTPLFGPVAVPLCVALLRELKEWKKEKKRKAAERASREVDEKEKMKGD